MEVSRGAGRTYQVARTLSRLHRVEGVRISNPFFGASNESVAPLSSLLLFHSNQFEKRRTLSLSSLVGSMVHWPRSLVRERTPGWTPLKYHVSYGRKKSRRIHTQIGTCKVSSFFLSLSRTMRAARTLLSLFGIVASRSRGALLSS